MRWGAFGNETRPRYNLLNHPIVLSPQSTDMTIASIIERIGSSGSGKDRWKKTYVF
jgi:hypothetical protein